MSNPFSSGKIAAIVVLVVALLIAGWAISGYNSLVGASAAVDAQWAQVESQYQRRFDLVPNLVESVKGAMAQEQEVFTALADARSKYAGSQTVNEKVLASQQFDSALSRLLVVMENYPQLKSIDAVQTFMAQLEGTENRISVERMRFNDTSKSYNVLVQRFPSSILASIFGYQAREYFQAADGAATAPTVTF